MCWEQYDEEIYMELFWLNVNPYELNLAKSMLVCDYCNNEIDNTCNCVYITNKQNTYSTKLYYHTDCMCKDSITDRIRQKRKSGWSALSSFFNYISKVI